MTTMENVVPLRASNVRVTKVDLAKSDAVALAVLLNACETAGTIACAFHDTGRFEAATKMYDGISQICVGHEMVAKELIAQIKD